MIDIDKAQAIKYFLIRVPKTHNDTIKLKSGIELAVDAKWDEKSNRIHDGIVVAPPKKLEGVVQRGARVWFHHMVTHLQRKQNVHQDVYYAFYDGRMENSIECQVIAYQNPNEQITPLNWFILVKPTESSQKVTSSVISVVNLKNLIDNIGQVCFINDQTAKYFDLKVGDVVRYSDNSCYEVKIDGELYYRVRPQNVMYKIEQEHGKEVERV
jgi:co-chaperonin GroES (HSP10)